MQTSQSQQGGKKSKVVVPFYSRPPRFYGQTPAEIIREARAAVMATPAVGIKPVFTSRPFTPKENERSLFGNVMENRPPTSFGLFHSKNLQCQESSGHVKLPTIEFCSKRKNHSIFHFSNNLSLDNLAEDHDAEAFEEIGEIDFEKLPAGKKSHSCPKEGRMMKFDSYGDLHQRLFIARNSDSLVDKRVKSTRASTKSSGNVEKSKESYEDREKTGISTIFGDNVKPEPAESRTDSYRYMNMVKGGGDHDRMIPLAANLLVENESNDTFERPPKSEKGVKSDSVTDLGFGKIDFNETKYVSNDGQCRFEKGIEKTKSESQARFESCESEKGKGQRSVEGVMQFGSKVENSMEKSTATEVKSEYLESLKKDNKISKMLTRDEKTYPMPMEILKLYETAEYYGVDMKKNDDAQVVKTTKSSDVNKSSEKLKIDNPDAEPSGTIPSEKQQDLSESGRKSVENSEESKFPMNDKKKYHKSNEVAKNEEKKKAHEKWREKREREIISISDSPYTENFDFFWKNCYYKTKREDVDEEETVRENIEKPQKSDDSESFQRLMDKTNELFKSGVENSAIYEANCRVYRVLKSKKVHLTTGTKNKILKTLFLVADSEDAEVLLSIARLLLYLKVDSSLTAACKMIFKVARIDSNDHLFLNEEDILDLFMEGIGRASPLENAESCVYGYGALKFLTMNHNILSRTLHMGALDLMTLHLKLINTACAENGSVEEQTQHALFQLTGVLRHVAAGDGALPLFITTNCISVICKCLDLFQSYEDVVTNISRTLSLISTDESITRVLTSVENILTVIVGLMEKYRDNDKILIRLSFCLGNIVEHSDLARIQLLRSDNSLSVLLNLLKFYIDKDLEVATGQHLDGFRGDLNSEIIDDIIVKVIRIVANMSMNPIVGSNLTPAANVKKSLQLSQLLSVLLMRKDAGMTLLAALGCLNNVSYYCNTHSVLIDITQGIERVLGLESEDCQAEAARVLGNLTRHKEIRDIIYNTGGINLLIKLLKSKDQEVVRCVCGALVNMLLDSESRKQFLNAGGIDRLVDAIELFSGDWSLASLAGRAIWNSCADDLSSAISHNNVEQLINALATSLEEENWKDGDAAWEEFASIATDLLEKINSHLETA